METILQRRKQPSPPSAAVSIPLENHSSPPREKVAFKKSMLFQLKALLEEFKRTSEDPFQKLTPLRVLLSDQKMDFADLFNRYNYPFGSNEYRIHLKLRSAFFDSKKMPKIKTPSQTYPAVGYLLNCAPSTSVPAGIAEHPKAMSTDLGLNLQDKFILGICSNPQAMGELEQLVDFEIRRTEEQITKSYHRPDKENDSSLAPGPASSLVKEINSAGNGLMRSMDCQPNLKFPRREGSSFSGVTKKSSQSTEAVVDNQLPSPCQPEEMSQRTSKQSSRRNSFRLSAFTEQSFELSFNYPSLPFILAPSQSKNTTRKSRRDSTKSKGRVSNFITDLNTGLFDPLTQALFNESLKKNSSMDAKSAVFPSEAKTKINLTSSINGSNLKLNTSDAQQHAELLPFSFSVPNGVTTMDIIPKPINVTPIQSSKVDVEEVLSVAETPNAMPTASEINNTSFENYVEFGKSTPSVAGDATDPIDLFDLDSFIAEQNLNILETSAIDPTSETSVIEPDSTWQDSELIIKNEENNMKSQLKLPEYSWYSDDESNAKTQPKHPNDTFQSPSPSGILGQSIYFDVTSNPKSYSKIILGQMPTVEEVTPFKDSARSISSQETEKKNTYPSQVSFIDESKDPVQEEATNNHLDSTIFTPVSKIKLFDNFRLFYIRILEMLKNSLKVYKIKINKLLLLIESPLA